MQTFIRIVEAGSISKAAEQLNTVKSAVSKRLSNLEHSLGITLMNRTTRSLTLTDNGKTYYQRCLQIIDDVAELESNLKNSLCQLLGVIKITVPLSFGLMHLATALSRFNVIQEQVKFDIDFNDRKVDIINEGFDLAIRIGKLEDSSLIARKITTVRTLLSASQAYLDKHGTPKKPEDLSNGHVNLKYSNSNASLQFKNDKNKTIAIHLPNALIANNGDYLCQAALEGKGLLSTPDFICYKYIKSGQLIPVLADCYLPSEMGVYAIYPQTRQLSRKVRSLIDFLIQYFGEKPYWHLD